MFPVEVPDPVDADVDVDVDVAADAEWLACVDDDGEGFDWDAAVAELTADRLTGLPPGAELAEVLAVTDPVGLSLSGRVDAVVAWERLAAWAAAGQASALAALTAPTPEGDPAVGYRPGDPEEWVREEVACALHLSAAAAGNRLHVAQALTGRLGATRAALAAGSICYRKAADLALETTPLSDQVTVAVQDKVLAKAPGQTPAAFRRALRRAIMTADPADAHARQVRARAGRRVVMTPVQDGMAELWALLPAAGAATVMTALTRHAVKQKRRHDAAAGAVEPLDARRADALVDLAAGYLTGPGGNAGTGGKAGTGGGRPVVAVQVTASLATLLGICDEPGELAGYGPIPAQVARELAADGDWRRLITDGDGRLLDYGRSVYRPPAALADYLRARDRTCCFPGCAMPACRCDLDHGIPHNQGGPTSAANMGPLCERHHHGKHEAGWKLVRDEHGGCTWTSPAGKTYRTEPPGYP